MIRFWNVAKEIEKGDMVPHHRGTMLFSIGLLLMGGVTALWLFRDQ